MIIEFTAMTPFTGGASGPARARLVGDRLTGIAAGLLG